MAEHDYTVVGSIPISGYSDSDWARDKATGKSTSGGIVMPGTHLVKSWSHTQDSVALSSAEAELVALGKLAIESHGMRSMSREWKLTNEDQASTLYPDASAALSMTKRQSWEDASHQCEVLVAT